jgi:hypothetical protein
MARYKKTLNRAFGAVIDHFNKRGSIFTSQYTWRVKAVKADGTVITSSVTNHTRTTYDFWQVTLPTISYIGTPALKITSGTNHGSINGIEITIEKVTNQAATSGWSAWPEVTFARGYFTPAFDFNQNYVLEVTSLSLDFFSGDPVA